jgi:hypothetical protein
MCRSGGELSSITFKMHLNLIFVLSLTVDFPKVLRADFAPVFNWYIIKVWFRGGKVFFDFVVGFQAFIVADN